MLVDPVAKFRRRRGRGSKKPAQTPPAPPALTLVAAVYQSDDAPYTLTLQFDRAIDVAAFDGTQVTVKDGGINAVLLNATGPRSLLDPMTMRVELVELGHWGVVEVVLSASASSGIVAVDDAATWAGVTDLGLPYP